MNLESDASKKAKISTTEDFSMDDFDFKPITSGLGFHHSKAQDVKPVFMDKATPTTINTPMTPASPIRKEMSVYQNDLSSFYNADRNQTSAVLENNTVVEQPKVVKEKPAKTYPLATRSQRFCAYLMDLLSVTAVLGIVLTIMARTISMDLMQVWNAFPNEITPLVLILFAGFYVIYFSVFEKAPGSTIGKTVFGLTVVNLNNKPQSFSLLVLRSLITLANFLSLGLFAWFDLQNKVTQSKVIRIN